MDAQGQRAEPRAVAMQTLQTIRALADHMGEVARKPTSVVFKGVRLDTYWVAPHNALLTLMLFVGYLIWRRLAGLRRGGLYLKVWLPMLVSADLYLESRDWSQSSDDLLAAHFTWSCTNDYRLHRYLKGPLLDVMLLLAKDHRVVMTDHFIDFGPVDGTPAEAAALVNQVVEALPRPRPGTTDWDTELAEDDHPWVALRVTLSRGQATAWRLLLEGSGVPCELLGYDQHPPWGVATPVVPIQLFVPAHQVKYAEEVLAQPTRAGMEDVCHLCGGRIDQGAKRCPECGAAVSES